MKHIVKVILVLLVVIVGCQNSEEIENKSLEGTYVGTIQSDESYKSSDLKDKSDIIATVSLKGKQLEVHCYGEDIDEYFMLDYFEHNGNYMACLTGNDFVNLYGHSHGEGMSSGNHMNNMQARNSDWDRHRNNYHNQNEDHLYGRFDMNRQFFSCTFKWGNNVVTFEGLKE
jgi:hypothetical protein